MGFEAFRARPLDCRPIGTLQVLDDQPEGVRRLERAPSGFNTKCVDDQIKILLKGLQREKGKSKETTRKAKALTGDVIRAAGNDQVRNKPEAIDRRGLRDRALLSFV